MPVISKNNKFITDTIQAEFNILNAELDKWKRRSRHPYSLIYPYGYPDKQVEDLRKRISYLEICLDLLNQDE